MSGAIFPVVAPADDEVTAVGWMAVVAEVAALEFKFNANLFPALRSNLPFRLAIRESDANGFHDVTQFLGEHSKEQNDALFVDRFMAEPGEV